MIPKGDQKDNRRKPKGDHNNIEKDTKIMKTHAGYRKDEKTKPKGNRKGDEKDTKVDQ